MNSKKECKKYLAAFADGELDVDQNLRLLEHMKMDPNATARVAHQQQLREAVCRCMSSDCPATPDTLKQSLTQMLEEPTATDKDIIARIRPYQFAAWTSSIAAVIAICLSLFLFYNQAQINTPLDLDHAVAMNNQPASDSPSYIDFPAASILPVSEINRFSNRHTSCSQEISRLQSFAINPTNIEQMPKVVNDHLGKQSYPCLDLSPMGYEFARAGPCHLPSQKAAHLIYQAKNKTGTNDTISLWIAPDEGQFNFKKDKVFRVRGQESDHPVIIWRHNNLVYYIIGDSYPAVQKAYLTLNHTEQTGA